jgi:hypothetical protein
MWGHRPVSNLIMLQRIAALKTLDREIQQLHAEGYHTDRDRLLEQRLDMMEQLRKGPVA